MNKTKQFLLVLALLALCSQASAWNPNQYNDVLEQIYIWMRIGPNPGMFMPW